MTHIELPGAASSDDRQYRRLVEAVTDYAIYMLDRNGMVISWNPGAQRLKGYGATEIIGQNFSRFYTKEDQASGEPEAALRIAAQEGRFEQEGWHVRKDGSYFWANVVIDPVRDSDGTVIGFAKVTRDISARKDAQAALDQAREALFQSQKMEAVGQLTAGVAHDFNNMLAVILGCLDLLESRVRQGRLDELSRYFAGAQGAAKNAAALTHRLLAFSRQQALSPKAISLDRLVDGMEEMIRRTAGPAITVETIGTDGLWTAMVDPGQLENALLNLCINACQAMPDGGRLTVTTANKELDESLAQAYDLPPGQYVLLCVADTGCGMTAETVGRAFDPFFTTKPLGVGTGLGLSMVHGFARQSGGHAKITSEPGRGSTISVFLPRLRCDPEPEAAQTGPPEPVAALPNKTVLVVDDEPTVRMLVTDVLEEMGHVVIEAASGPQALAAFGSGVRIDLLVTDIGLPGGMNGRQLASAARESEPGLKVLFITGYAESAVIGSGALEPGMHIMAKPFALELLGSRIKDILSQA